MNNNGENTRVVPLSATSPSADDIVTDSGNGGLLDTNRRRVEDIRENVRTLRLKRKDSKGPKNSSSSNLSVSSSSSRSSLEASESTASTFSSTVTA